MIRCAIVLAVSAIFCCAMEARADIRLCRYTSGQDKNKVVKIELPRGCPRGTEQLLYQPEVFGGDGTDLSVAANATLNLQETYTEYKDCTIGAGATLYLSPGTVLRCNGSFTNDGTVTVFSRARGGTRRVITAGLFQVLTTPAYPGFGGSMPGEGAFINSSTETAYGASDTLAAPPRGMPRLMPGGLGGSGGGPGLEFRDASRSAGAGGGSIVIIAKRRLTNNGSILAVGESSTMSGGGGGAGGIIVLASVSGIVNSGTISVQGGTGGDAAVFDTFTAAIGGGGGGGGGLVTLVSPGMSVGNIVVSGGSGGAGSNSGAGGANTLRFGGSAGGVGYGSGGGGGDCSTAVLGAGSSGGDGYVDAIQLDPKLVF